MIHVEMMKTEAHKIEMTRNKYWREEGRSKMMPEECKKRTIAPLYKGKEEMGDPKNFRLLCILSYARKIVAKTVVARSCKKSYR